jgi:hypothetical protein
MLILPLRILTPQQTGTGAVSQEVAKMISAVALAADWRDRARVPTTARRLLFEEVNNAQPVPPMRPQIRHIREFCLQAV